MESSRRLLESVVPREGSFGAWAEPSSVTRGNFVFRLGGSGDLGRGGGGGGNSAAAPPTWGPRCAAGAAGEHRGEGAADAAGAAGGARGGAGGGAEGRGREGRAAAGGRPEPQPK